MNYSQDSENFILVTPRNLRGNLHNMVSPSTDESLKILEDFKINDVIMKSVDKIQNIYKLKKGMHEVQYYEFNNVLIKIEFEMLNDEEM